MASPIRIRFVTLAGALLVLDVPGLTSGLTHGWDCVSCGSNSMLAANFGTWRSDINLTDPWWFTTIAKSHAAIILNNFWHQGITPGSYNGTGEDSKVAIARALKAENPRLKVYFYQPADRLGDTAYVLNALHSHPEWWLRDDNGNLIPFGGHPQPGQPVRPQIDTSVPAAQDFFANLSVSLFHSHADAKDLLDGVMVDGTSWSGASRYGPNVSAARYRKLFDGKMAMLAKMQNILKELNGGEGQYKLSSSAARCAILMSLTPCFAPYLSLLTPFACCAKCGAIRCWSTVKSEAHLQAASPKARAGTPRWHTTTVHSTRCLARLVLWTVGTAQMEQRQATGMW